MDLEEKVRLLEVKIKTLENNNNDLSLLSRLVISDTIVRLLLLWYLFK